MKFTLCFKTPDVSDQIDEPNLCEKCEDNESEDYCSDCLSKADDYEKANGLIKTFVEYGEYVYIEFDTESNTATVKKP